MLGCVLACFPVSKVPSLTLQPIKIPCLIQPVQSGILFLLLNLAGIVARLCPMLWIWWENHKPLKKASKKQNEFIAATSHELRAPLCVIRSSLSAARSSPQNREQFMDNINEGIFAVSYLVGDIFASVASADAGHWINARIAPLDVDTLLIIDMYERFEPSTRTKGVHLLLELQILLPG